MQTLNLVYNPPPGPWYQPLNFPPTQVGTQGVVRLGPTYSANLTYIITGANASEFSFSSTSSVQYATCSTSPTIFCPSFVYFTPSAAGLRTAALTLPGTGSASMTGTGVAGPGFSVTAPGFLSSAVGATAASIILLTNYGSGPLTVSVLSLTGPDAADFAVKGVCANILANATCSNISVTATPHHVGYGYATLILTDSTGLAQQTLALSDGGTTTIGYPQTSPTSLTFGSTAVGTISASQAVAVTATFGDPVNATVSGPFQLTRDSACTATPCALYVAFSPTAGGVASGMLTVTDAFYNIANLILLTGSGGAPAVGLSASALTFASRAVGSTSLPQTVTITNTGNASLTLSSVVLAGMNAGDYVLTNGCSSSMAAGANCSLTVNFAPTASGSRTAYVQIVSNASSSPDTVSLSGTAQ